MSTPDNSKPADHLIARAEGWYGNIAKQAESSGCVFCKLKDEYVITRDGEGENQWVLTVNLYPRSLANLLVIPSRHIEKVREITSSDATSRLKLQQLGISLLEQCFGINNVYLLTREGSDKTVRHLHDHVMQYFDGILMWYDEQGKPGKVLRTPEEAGYPLLSPVHVAQTLREKLNSIKGRN